MGLVRCMKCHEKIIECKDYAILTCPYCGNGAIEVLEIEEDE